MKNKLFVPLMLVVIVAGMYSCDDFIEKDLSKKTVTILSPANNYTASSYTQHFWWEDVKGASKYNLQIVKPTFATAQQLLVDTTLTGNQFTYTLQPGSYQWRLRALNNSSHTDYVIYNLTVDSSLDIHNEPVQLLSPVNNYQTNVFAHTFTWHILETATNYLFQVLDYTGAPIITQTTTANTYTCTLPAGGTYSWRVQGQNIYTSSEWGTNTIVVDTTAPAAPILTYGPPNDTTSSYPVPLSWSSAETGASYVVSVSYDSAFTSPVDTVTTNLNYNLYNAVPGHYYYWKVKAIDAATNAGPYSGARRIKRQ